MVLNNTKLCSTSSTSAQRATSLPAAGNGPLPFVCQSREQSCCTRELPCPGRTPASEKRHMLHFSLQHGAEAPSPSSQSDQEQRLLERS